MTIQIYSDFLCPWCYIGHRRFEAVFTEIPSGSHPLLTWRSYQLSEQESRTPGLSAAEAMMAWYPNATEALARIEHIIQVGLSVGLKIDLSKARPVNTFDAHRLSKMAAEMGAAPLMRELIFRAYHTEGRNIADPVVLAQIASSAGLDENAVTDMLRGQRFSADILEDRDHAAIQGVTGVPKLIIEGRSVQPLPPTHAQLAQLVTRDGRVQ